MYAAAAAVDGPLMPLLPFIEEDVVGEAPRLPAGGTEVSRGGKAFEADMSGSGRRYSLVRSLANLARAPRMTGGGSSYASIRPASMGCA